MEKGVFVKDLKPSDKVSGLFVIGTAEKGQARNGPYWKLILTDATGSVEAKIWYPMSAEYPDILPGSLAMVTGRCSLYREQLQLALDDFSPLGPEEMNEINRGDFVAASAFDPEEMFASLKKLCLEEFKYPPWRKLILSVLNNAAYRKAFMTMPAAKSMHHAYAGGLLEHTLGVCRLCRFIADQHPELDRQALLAGAFFHDFGKIRELSADLVSDYTDEGKLLGHIFLGLEMLEPLIFASGLDPYLAEHLRHLVLSHHGQLEFGAARLPQTPEAFALHYADNMDAKLAQCRSVFQAGNMECGDWSPWQRSLDRALYRPKQTPCPVQKNEPQAGKGEDECLSLWKE